jgi:ribA/ribD-fused uncharacterized protein
MAAKPIFFWSEKSKYGDFSNFSTGPFLIEGTLWPTTEHYFAAMKSSSPAKREDIRALETPMEAKQAGRNVQLRANWDLIKYDVMVVALRHKFSPRYPRLMDLLLSTGDAQIFEDSPYDKIWGTGVRGAVGTGMNLLGKALMQVREELRKAKSHGNPRD